jgi:hypothetical protein
MTLQAELAKAAQDANAMEFIERTDNKFDTPVGEKGIQLSGGQVCPCAVYSIATLTNYVLPDLAPACCDCSCNGAPQADQVRWFCVVL